MISTKEETKDIIRSGLKISEFSHNSGFLAVLFFHFSKTCEKVLSSYFGYFYGKKLKKKQQKTIPPKIWNYDQIPEFGDRSFYVISITHSELPGQEDQLRCFTALDN